MGIIELDETGIFQSTLPVRGATASALKSEYGIKFQSTLPVRGATRSFRAPPRAWIYFNPRSP